MSYETATIIAFIGAAYIFFLIGNSFRKKEDDLESTLSSRMINNVFFRGIFYIISIGFISFAIAASQQFVVLNGAGNQYLNATFNGAVALVGRTSYILYVIFFVLFLILFVENYLMNKKIAKEITGRFSR